MRNRPARGSHSCPSGLNTMSQFARNDHTIALVTDTMLAGMRRQPIAERVSALKMAKSTAVVTTPTPQNRTNCTPGKVTVPIRKPLALRRFHRLGDERFSVSVNVSLSLLRAQTEKALWFLGR